MWDNDNHLDLLSFEWPLCASSSSSISTPKDFKKASNVLIPISRLPFPRSVENQRLVKYDSDNRYLRIPQSISVGRFIFCFPPTITHLATTTRWPRSSRCPSERCAKSTARRSSRGTTSTPSAYRRWRLWSRTRTTATSPPKTTTVIRNWIWNFRNEAAKACWPKYEVLCAATTPRMGFFNQILWNGKLCTRFCVSATSSWTRQTFDVVFTWKDSFLNGKKYLRLPDEVVYDILRLDKRIGLFLSWIR